MGLLELWYEILDFLKRGGTALTAIVLVTLLMWTLIFQRALYFWFSEPHDAAAQLAAWQRAGSLPDWHAQQLRRYLLSAHRVRTTRFHLVISNLVRACPLLGLLGTVIGMIEVFEVMAVAGNSNPRFMAAGISKATITTMAGMVAALSGLALSTWLPGRAAKAQAALANRLDHGHARRAR